MNYFVDHMVYASLFGKSLFLYFGKGFLGFHKIFTPEVKGCGLDRRGVKGKKSILSLCLW